MGSILPSLFLFVDIHYSINLVYGYLVFKGQYPDLGYSDLGITMKLFVDIYNFITIAAKPFQRCAKMKKYCGPKYLGRHVFTNIVDPDQTVP